jgi:hypothetical protein
MLISRWFESLSEVIPTALVPNQDDVANQTSMMGDAGR